MPCRKKLPSGSEIFLEPRERHRRPLCQLLEGKQVPAPGVRDTAGMSSLRKVRGR